MAVAMQIETGEKAGQNKRGKDMMLLYHYTPSFH